MVSADRNMKLKCVAVEVNSECRYAAAASSLNGQYDFGHLQQNAAGADRNRIDLAVELAGPHELQTCRGLFSTLSTPLAARKDLSFRMFRDLQN